MQKCVYLHIRMKNYECHGSHKTKFTTSERYRILSQKSPSPNSILQLYVYCVMKKLWADKNNLLRIKRVDFNHGHSNDIGKYKIEFSDGRDLLHSNILTHIPDFAWPNYPTVLNTESEAKVFKACWAEYIDAQLRAIS